jgi:hypothetical protein
MLIYTPNAPSVSTNNLISSSRVDLTITEPGSNGGSVITSYKIYINGSYTGSTGYAGTTMTYQATNLTASTQYTFTVTAVNEIGEGSPSAGSITTTMNAPSVTTTVVSVSQVNLTISPPTNNIQQNPITSYKIYINGNSTNAGSATADVSGNATYIASSLTPNTGYSFTVAAVSIDGEGAKSTVATATTSNIVPNAPTITATAASSSQINIAITPPASNGGTAITSYKVYLNNVLNGSTTTTSYSATGLSANTSYSFTVSAVNALGEGSQSSAASATTSNIVPNAPTITATAVSTSQGNSYTAEMEWQGVDELNADDIPIPVFFIGYTATNTIYNNNIATNFAEITLQPGTYNYTGLISYSFVVSSEPWVLPTIAFVNASNLNIISTLYQSTQQFVGDEGTQITSNSFTLTAPTTVSIRYYNGAGGYYNIAAGEYGYSVVRLSLAFSSPPVSTHQINIAITPPASNGGTAITSYKVYRNGVYNESTTTTSYSATGLSASTSYSFTVSAVNALGEGSQSSAASATTSNIVPNAPTITATAVSSSQINIAITPPASNGGTAITSYKVYRNGVYNESTTTTSYSATGLSANTPYSFTVSAVNALGEGSQSSAASATTSNIVPNAPTITATATSSSQINIAITAPASNGGTAITSYKVYRNGVYNNESTTTTSYSATGLSANTPYSFTVSAVNALGEGAKSSAASATTSNIVPNAPTITATAVSTSQINIAITAPASNGGTAITSYKVYRNGVYNESTTTTSYYAIGLSASTSYSFTVSDVNALGEGTKSSAASATTTSPTVPRAPTISTSASSSSAGSFFYVTITPPSSNGGAAITSYNIYNNGYAFGTTYTTSYTFNATAYVYSPTLYNITVRAVNAVGQGPSSANSAVTVYPYSAP